MIKRVKNKIERELIKRLFDFNLDKRLLDKQKGKAKIIMYHGIDKVGSLNFNHRFISIKCLEYQVRYFRENCKILSLNEIFDPDRYDHHKLNIAFTFDDGYRNNLTYGLPVFEQNQVPFTIFITSCQQEKRNILWADYIDIASNLCDKSIEINGVLFEKEKGRYASRSLNVNLKQYLKRNGTKIKDEVMDLFSKQIPNFQSYPQYDDYWRLLDADDIRNISKSKYVTIGAHGHLHNNLDQMDINDAIREMSISKSYLENIVQHNIKSIAFPDGAYDKNVKEEAKKMGFEQLVAVDYRLPEDNSDHSIRDRVGVYSYQSCRHQIHTVLSHDL